MANDLITYLLDVRPFSSFLLIGIGIITLVFARWALIRPKPVPGIPVVLAAPKGWRGLGEQNAFIQHARTILKQGLRECTGCFQVWTSSGYKVVVPNRFADELKSHPDLSFNEAFQEPFFHLPGFEDQYQALQNDWFIQDVVRIKLTQSLALVTDALVEEAIFSSHSYLGDSMSWSTIRPKFFVLDAVSRLSSVVFLGKKLARDKSWLQIAKDHTVDSFAAQDILRAVHPLLRWPTYYFDLTCVRLRQQVKTSRKLIAPEIEARRKRAVEAQKEGRKFTKESDAISWMVDIAKDMPVDYTAAQLALTTAAVHTTSETIANCILQLCEAPEIVPALRAEIIDVLNERGWSKTSLPRLKLMDSFMKEVQRTHAMAMTSMKRKVKKSITLSDGTHLPAGITIMISDDKTHDGEIYSNPAEFDAERFLQLRQQPGEENRHQFVTTTAEHLSFGHGQHACPGRFFASNEIKIFLCVFLLSYDCQFVPGEKRKNALEFETSMMVDPTTEVQVRKRTPEIDLVSPTGTAQS
ncbi:unnamed protein product [Zymoseptoria tritici ST99CH_1E4]|uniref:P450 monooxygenase n=2 Tax=Zymoseptoria tritici TaxID=1047171 RepID=F9XFD5_ZYMTI|nr:putative P450 monooxygenase [Zymoseptoria tritici IPO323]EGP85637.1 putative P450 monooxygenase [Zymoseptoria tritici IPO323]SMR55203.1 unnamed protein product [Zymoseptoria tritici ST99CH_1E4]